MRRFIEQREGISAVLFALLIGILGGIVALAVDVTRFYNSQTELQDAADAACLAAASQLDNSDNAMQRAEDAVLASSGITLVGNDQRFATDGLGDAVTIVDEDVLFYLDLDQVAADNPLPEILDNDASANFVEVTIAPRTVGYAFASLLGIFDADSTARAVCTMGQVTCKQPPIMVCNPADNGADNSEGFPFEDYKNVGVLAQEGGNGAPWEEGNFGLLANDALGLDYTESFGAVDPLAVCFGDTVTSNPGQVSSVRLGMWVRHDIYHGPMGGDAGNSNYRPARNPIKGLVKGNQCAWQGQGWNHPAQRFGYSDSMTSGKGPTDCPINGLGATSPGCPGPPNFPADPDYEIDTMGYPRDNCHYREDPNVPAANALGTPDTVADDAVCGTATATPPSPDDHWRFGNSEWDINTYMRVNHGLVWPDDFPAAHPLQVHVNVTAPGDRLIPGLPSRYEVSQWEERAGPFAAAPGSDLVDNGTEDVTTVTPANFCGVPNPADADTDSDRLVIRMAIANCSAEIHDCNGDGVFNEDIQGQCEQVVLVPGPSILKVMLTEPMGVYDSNDDLYVEIIGPGEAQGLLSTVNRFVLTIVE